MFVERLLELINENGITRNKLLTDLSLSKNSFVDWGKRGTIPSGDVLLKLAQYFKVSPDYLLGNTDKTELYISEYPTMVKYRRLTPGEQDRVDALIEDILSGRVSKDSEATQKKPAPTDEGELDKAIIDMILQLQLSPHELQRLVDFAKGIAAARTEPTSGEYPDR